ncbi:MAG: hypothetical protein C5B57_09600 [Blastocatellia bacterium]|nr:MAG: hypothetical protein C5B57_09600 [Blastocatellia bacterium]
MSSIIAPRCRQTRCCGSGPPAGAPVGPRTTGAAGAGGPPDAAPRPDPRPAPRPASDPAPVPAPTPTPPRPTAAAPPGGATLT